MYDEGFLPDVTASSGMIERGQSGPSKASFTIPTWRIFEKVGEAE
jgi:hypothetical protein